MIGGKESELRQRMIDEKCDWGGRGRAWGVGCYTSYGRYKNIRIK